MPDCGLLFAITESEISKIKAINSDIDKIDYMQELEDKYYDEYPERIAELDTSWEALHRALCDGALNRESGTYPLNHVILGGQNLLNDENDDYYLIYKDLKHVLRISKALDSVSEKTIHKGFFKIDQNTYEYEVSEEEFELMMDWYPGVVEIYNLAVKQNLFILFVAY